MPKLLTALLLAVGLPAQAQGTLSVCYDDWAPYVTYNSRSGHSGLSFDLLNEIFGVMHYKLRFQSATQERCLAAARAGKVDIMLFADAEMLPKWQLSRVPMEFWLLAAWVPKDAPPSRFASLAQFHGQRVGWVRDYIYPAPVQQFSGWQKVPIGDAIDGLRQLSARRVDVMFEDVFWTERMRRQHKLQIRMLTPLVAAQPQFLALRPGLAKLAEVFDSELNARIRSGEMDLRYRAVLGVSYDAVRRGDYARALVAETATP
ncbi:substrate-binding periplasmic protein [Chitinimonas taiwanensis]|uniref:substrate-binding periplasmic protein n=1 Tax=Chitinimonas taiwanensis TaxID=240412 RepID=UPI0035B27AC5